MEAVSKIWLDMSVEEFLNWNPGDGRRWQLVDGEPRAMSPANLVHSYLQGELIALLRIHLRSNDLPCDVFPTPGVIPATMSARNMRVPDIAVSCAPFVENQAALIEPVVIVEILSPSNAAQTWSNVWAYTSIPSVREILILRADMATGKLLRRLDDGTWPDQASPVEKELELASLGFRVSVAELYSRTPIRPG